MPRTYRRRKGARSYADYPEDMVDIVVSKIKDKEISIHKAARDYKLSKSLLFRRIHAQQTNKPGGQTVLSPNEEAIIVKRLIQCSDFGFPLQPMDLRVIVKTYLDEEGRTVPKFSLNLPGPDWAAGFIKRNKALTLRVANDIKRSRAAVSEQCLRDYHARLTEELKDIPPSNIFNYDETNLADKTSASTFLFRRGVKYPDRIINMTKSCVTIMMCGSADGTLLPPFIIYKAENLYDSWIRGAPKGSPCCTGRCCKRGTQFHNTISGWIDTASFSKWFNDMLLPHLMNLEGPKAVIGDNLSAHFSESVLKVAEENNIKFICLPPNSTDKTQPLDVAFFAPMKGAWKKVLQNFKNNNPNASAVNKQAFPTLVTELLNEKDFKKKIKENLLSGFRSTGIYPQDINPLLKRLGPGVCPGTPSARGTSQARAGISTPTSMSLLDNPELEESPEAARVSSTFEKFLMQNRFPSQRGGRANRRPRGARIPSGSRVVATTPLNPDSTSGNSSSDEAQQPTNQPSTSSAGTSTPQRRPVKRPIFVRESESATDLDTDLDAEEIYNPQPTRRRQSKVVTQILTPTSTPVKAKTRNRAPRSAPSTPIASPRSSQSQSSTDSASQKGTYNVGDLVLTRVFMGKSSTKYKKYLSIIQTIDGQHFLVMFLSSAGENNAVFTPNEDDTSVVTQDEIEGIISEPYTMNHRGQYVFSKAIDLL